ncbi:histidine kinase [Asanoa sp. NPDC049573]|uniref:sensor histidine kinase n=1 Tax=Asanoa sp. NPDC049573 TaxID=3155396 RepID=UPI00342775B4
MYRRSGVLDGALALALVLAWLRYVHNGVGLIVGWPTPGPLERLAQSVPIQPAEAMLLVVLAAAPLVLRRRYPLLVLWLVSAGTVPSLGVNPDLVFVACIVLGVAIYSAAAYSPHRRWTLLSLPVSAALLVVLFQNAALPNLPNAWVGALVLLPIAIAGIGIHVRRQHDERDREIQAREQAEALRTAAERERARIARELHDVVTHHVSMMVIQTGAARTVLTSAPDDVREALLAVETTGRTALRELRGVLGVLTTGTEAELAPPPGLDAVPELIARVRDAGMSIDYRVIGEPRPIPVSIGLTAYRIAQEALTNTVKHAAGASASVIVEYTADQLRVEVTDAGSPAAPAATGAGYGLAGLRERVCADGGTLHAGRRLTGGYRVRALLPLGAP